jgi:hypothetical protein
MQLVALGRSYAKSAEASYKTQGGERRDYRLFFYGGPWQLHSAALDWLAGEADPQEIVATSTPHWAHLKTGLRAVMPPFEVDVRMGQRFLESVPVSYIIVDHLEYADIGFAEISRRYVAPVVEAFPERWELIYSPAERGSRIYRRISRGESIGPP